MSEPSSDQFLSSIFLIPKKNGGHRSIVNLKKLNQYISCVHFKMEVLFLLKEHLRRGNCRCKIDRKDTYFSVLLHEGFLNFLKFKWKGSIYQFLCRVYFGFGPATRIFTKIMKILISLLWRLILHDILISAQYFNNGDLEGGNDSSTDYVGPLACLHV